MIRKIKVSSNQIQIFNDLKIMKLLIYIYTLKYNKQIK